MHETGLVYIPSFERVGGEEFDRQSERTAQSSQLRRIAKTVLQLSIAMGLGPVEVGATSDQCPTLDVSSVSFVWSYSSPICVVLFLVVISVCMFYGWKMLKQQGREFLSAQMQLADHYDFAAGLDERLHSLENATDGLSSHVSLMEGELHGP